MKPIYTDIHIHTSENPDSLNTGYPWRTLLGKVEANAQGADYLISLTDHNTINKAVYLDIVSHKSEFPSLNLLLGTELHINYAEGSKAYHCHIFFKCDITESNMDAINAKLDILYPNKQVDRFCPTIPTLSKIIQEFDEYDYLLLPHGGQSHCTFDKAIPKGTRFDTTMERSIYYNQFDGFTARSETGLDETKEYFRRLGIVEFVNLITCSDNYHPQNYPVAKNANAEPFIPTWMLAEPTFDGLRLSLSETSRLIYSDEKPDIWAEYIRGVKLQDDNIDIDVNFSSGLNVIIGGSSSGKTLLVDSLVKKIRGGENLDVFEESHYNNYHVKRLNVDNPSGRHPHFISQNYITQIVNSDISSDLSKLEIINVLFPKDDEFNTKVTDGINQLNKDVTDLISCVENIEDLERQLNSLMQLGKLIVLKAGPTNVIKPFMPSHNERQSLIYSKSSFEKDLTDLNRIKSFLSSHPLLDNCNEEINRIIDKLKEASQISVIEQNINGVIIGHNRDYADKLQQRNQETETKIQDFENAKGYIRQYVFNYYKFKKILEHLTKYNVQSLSKSVVSMGHTLNIRNDFKLTKAKVLEVFNRCLRAEFRVSSIEELTPQRFPS